MKAALGKAVCGAACRLNRGGQAAGWTEGPASRRPMGARVATMTQASMCGRAGLTVAAMLSTVLLMWALFPRLLPTWLGGGDARLATILPTLQTPDTLVRAMAAWVCW